jgi:site-specific recombinase XerD
MDLSSWITEYEAYLHISGYAPRRIARRIKYLSCLEPFVVSLSLKSLEEFKPEHASGFIDYWIRYGYFAKGHVKQGKQSVRRKYSFQPPHHYAVQWSLRSFFRWAQSTGRMQKEIFPWKTPVVGNYFLPGTVDYLEFCKKHKGLSKNSLLQIELFVRRLDHFLHAEQLTQWDQIESRHIDDFVREQAGKRIKRIQRIYKILRGLFRFLFSIGLLTRDWASALHAPRQYWLDHVPRAIAPDQVLRLLHSIDLDKRGGKRDFAVILMAASLGVRASEIASLCLEDFDWKREAVRFQQHKNRKVLWMPLSLPLIEALASYLQNERPKNCAQRAVFLRLNTPWGALTPGGLAGTISKRMHAAGIAASGHQLRHGFASELLRVGVNFSTLQELLGHSHISSTQIYTKIDLAQLREVAGTDAEGYPG